ncbi:MAG: hypothetical protein ACPL7B_03290 [Candidatus Poribacteria bacterium]
MIKYLSSRNQNLKIFYETVINVRTSVGLYIEDVIESGNEQDFFPRPSLVLDSIS